MEKIYYLHDTIGGDMIEVGSLEQAREYVLDAYVDGSNMHPDFSSFDVYEKVGEVYVEEDILGNATGIKSKSA